MAAIESYIEFEGTGRVMGWYAKGHVDKARFRDAVEAEWGYDYPPEDVKHTYMRYVPAGPDFEKVMLILLCDGPARGAFAVTHLENSEY